MSNRYLLLITRILRGDRLIWSYIRQWLSFQIQRPFKRVLFWFASGRDLDRFDPLHLSFRSTAGRRNVSDTLFSERPTTAVILGIGQSNIANEGEASARYEPKGEVYNFNFFDGKCYAAKDPLLGASIDRSNVLTRLGDLLVERRNYDRVLLLPIAHGGSYASEWSPNGRMFPRLEWTLEQLREKPIRITHILWQQGEAEAAASKPNAEEWMRHFTATAGAIRALGVDAPIYVAQCTVCGNDPNETIRVAQRTVVNQVSGILPGPDIDAVGRDERYDGCHFSAVGLRRAAELWYEALLGTK
jgi:Carbohydrate esterase, sialic acid-specific acetylesterase